MPHIDLTGKPIAIAGASSGIGAATAIACAQAGMPVAIAARREDKLARVAEEIRSRGGRVITVRGDVCSEEDCRRLVEATVAEFGSIYSVFANAGYGLEAAVHEMSDREMREIFECNFFGTLNVIRPAVPHMIESRQGHVLVCSSCLSRMSIAYYAAYSATKAAQAHIGRAMAMELHPHGVHVSTVHPVGTRTEFFETVRQRNGGAKLVRHGPEWLRHPPERVARAIVRSLRRPRAEVWTSPLVRLGMAVCNAFPGIETFAMRKMTERRRRNMAEHAHRAPPPPEGAPSASSGSGSAQWEGPR